MIAMCLLTTAMPIALCLPPEIHTPEPEPEPRVVAVERPHLHAEAPPEPEPASTGGGPVPEPWLSLAICESGMNGEPRWDYNGGSGYDGGLQFHPRTWTAFDGGEFAAEAWAATPAQQVQVAERVLAEQGWGAWPACSSKLGLR